MISINSRARHRCGAAPAEIHRTFDQLIADGAGQIQACEGIPKDDLGILAMRQQRPARHQRETLRPDMDRAAVGRFEPDQAFNQRLFARAFFADDAQRFTPPHFERYVAARLDDARSAEHPAFAP